MSNELKTSRGILYVFLVWAGCFVLNFGLNISVMQVVGKDCNNYGTMIGTCLFLLLWIYILIRSLRNQKLLKILLVLDIGGVVLALLCIFKMGALIEILNWPYMVGLIGLENFMNQELYFKIQLAIFMFFGLVTGFFLCGGMLCLKKSEKKRTH